MSQLEIEDLTSPLDKLSVAADEQLLVSEVLLAKTNLVVFRLKRSTVQALASQKKTTSTLEEIATKLGVIQSSISS